MRILKKEKSTRGLWRVFNKDELLNFRNSKDKKGSLQKVTGYLEVEWCGVND